MESIFLKFIVSKWANFFFLIDNLALPIDSMHRVYNQNWLEKFGELSDREKEALNEYRSLKKSIWNKGGNESLGSFESSFYQPSGPELQNQSQEVRNVFEVFKDRFSSMWKESESILLRNRDLVEVDFSEVRAEFNQAFSAIGKLYGVNEFSKPIEIYLVVRPLPGFTGGRLIVREPSPKILIESGVVKKKDQEQKSRKWLLILHELTHACFENDSFFKLLDEYLARRKSLGHFLEKYPATKTPEAATRRALREMIINSVEYNIFVRGKFEPDYAGGTEDGARLLEEFRNYFEKNSITDELEKESKIITSGSTSHEYIAWKLEGFVRPYLENGKLMDEQFLDNIYNVLKEFPDNLLTDLKTLNKKG